MAVVSLVVLTACGGGSKTITPTATSATTRATIPAVSTETAVASAPGAPVSTGEAAALNDATRAASLPTCTETLSSHGFMNYDSLEANLKCIIPYFTWPPNRHPSLDWINSQVPQDKVPSHYPYQTGLEYGVISGNNICAWELTWLDARKTGDSNLEAEALHMLTDVIPNFQTMIRGFPNNVFDAGTLGLQKDIAAKVALGDPSAVETEAEGCAAIQWANGS